MLVRPMIAAVPQSIHNPFRRLAHPARFSKGG